MPALNTLAQQKTMTLMATPSLVETGFFDDLLPEFEKSSDIAVQVREVAMEKIFQAGKACGGDAVIMAETRSISALHAESYAELPKDLMYDQLVIVGPSNGPSEVYETNLPVPALWTISDLSLPYVVYGKMHTETPGPTRYFWKNAGRKSLFENREASWFHLVSASMTEALKAAVELDGYILSDMASWLMLRNKGSHKILVEGHETLRRPYVAMQIFSGYCPDANAQEAKVLIEWLLSEEGQNAIAKFRLAEQQIFFPNARH